MVLLRVYDFFQNPYPFYFSGYFLEACRQRTYRKYSEAHSLASYGAALEFLPPNLSARPLIVKTSQKGGHFHVTIVWSVLSEGLISLESKFVGF